MIFILQLLDVVYHTDWFANVEPSLHPWNESNLMIIYDFQSIVEVQFANILLRIFVFAFIRDIGL